jgi:lipoprotein-releasing system permease protein
VRSNRPPPRFPLSAFPFPTLLDLRLLLARRYLFSRRSATLITVITGLSVVGVAIGVAALVVVLSVMNGFYGFARDLLVSLDPHVRIVCTGGCPEATADSLRRVAAALPEQPRTTAYVEGKALVALAGGGADVNKVVVVRGVEPGAFVGARALEGAAVMGTTDLARRDGQAGVLMGTTLANRLGLVATTDAYAGSEVTLISAQGVEAALSSPFGLPQLYRFEVRGLFEMEAAYDESHAFVALPEAQRLFGAPGRITGLDLRLADLDDAADVKAALVERLSAERFTVETWYDLHEALYGVMALEKWGASVILLLIVVVAAFNIVGALTMIVIEKRRDVGVLAAMGLSPKKIRHVFLLEGLLVGVVGTGAGLALGLGLSALQAATGFVPLSGGDAFLLASYPVDVRPTDVLFVAATALGLCTAAALYPAHRAAAQDPAVAVSQP